MSTLTGTISNEKGFSVFIKNHPLISYFILAYAVMWFFISPMVIDALELAAIPEALSFASFVLSSLLGPTVAAFWVTGVLEGKDGMHRLFRRMFQFRAGLQWYAVIFIVPIVIWVGAYSFIYNGAPIANLMANPSLLLSVFLPGVLIGLVIPSIGEEPGWRGFAFPRLQKQYGPIVATLILGTLHGIWHLPALFTPLFDPFTLEGFAKFVLTSMVATFLYSWVYNGSRGNVWIAIVLHASGNAATQLTNELVPKDVEFTGFMKVLESGWVNLIAFGIVAILLLVLTRGTLGYRPEREDVA